MPPNAVIYFFIVQVRQGLPRAVLRRADGGMVGRDHAEPERGPG